MNPNSRTTGALVLLSLVVLAGVGGTYAFASNDGDEPGDASDSSERFGTFESEAALRAYLAEAGGPGVGGGNVAAPAGAASETVVEADVATEAADDGAAAGRATASRHSETNRQVASVDEPDIVKTDGRTIFYGGERRHRYRGDPGRTAVLSALPPEETDVVGEIDRSGELLLAGDTLLVISDSYVTGYDVSDRENPELRWEQRLNGTVETARLRDGTVYLVVGARLDYADPCPVRPLASVEVACTELHRPAEPVPVDRTYTALTLDFESGEVTDSVSYVGSGRNGATYVSENAIYATYVDAAGHGERYLDFLLTDGRSALDEELAAELEQLREYDLGDRATRIEARERLHRWLATKDADERRAIEAELENGYADYAEENRREYTTTTVVKLGLDGGLHVAATGEVPGEPLNQFSLDEHEGHLRIATTVPRLHSEWGHAESVNDLYVLDEELETVGSVTGMGEDERVYSVRFVGDTGYVVTFRQIDPFHVLDLSDPENPTLDGELKLPGYSSYLHPLGDDRVLGVGEEDGRVKAVVFDASDPTDPVVEDDYLLDERFSEIARTHHAFLHDEKHGVFFLPGQRGGYVFSYDDGLELETAVAVDEARRAVYVGDYLYVFGESEVVVVDETTWERVRTVRLSD